MLYSACHLILIIDTILLLRALLYFVSFFHLIASIFKNSGGILKQRKKLNEYAVNNSIGISFIMNSSICSGFVIILFKTFKLSL